MASNILQVHTKGFCLLCFYPPQINSNYSKLVSGFEKLLWYLEVNPTQLWNSTVQVFRSVGIYEDIPANAVDNAEVSVTLCYPCSLLIENFLKESKQEASRLQLDNCLDNLCQSIKTGDENAARVREFHERMKPNPIKASELVNAGFATKLRRETLEKCTSKLNTYLTPITDLHKDASIASAICEVSPIAGAVVLCQMNSCVSAVSKSVSKSTPGAGSLKNLMQRSVVKKEVKKIENGLEVKTHAKASVHQKGFALLDKAACLTTLLNKRPTIADTALRKDMAAGNDIATQLGGAFKLQMELASRITKTEQLVKDLDISSHHNSGIPDSNEISKVNRSPKCTKIETDFSFECCSVVKCLQFIKTNLMTGHDDGKIRIWDVNTLDCTHTLDSRNRIAVTSLQCNDNFIVSTNCDKILIWDINTHKILDEFEARGVYFVNLKLIRNSLVALKYNGKLYSFNIKNSGEISLEANIQAHDAFSRALDADDEFVITGSYDKTVKVWRFGTLELVNTLIGHEWEAVCISYCNRIVVSGDYNNIRLWNVDTGECFRVIKVDNPMWCLAFDDTRLVSGHNNGTIQIWENHDVSNVDSSRSCPFKILTTDIGPIYRICLGDKSMVVSSNDTIKCFKLTLEYATQPDEACESQMEHVSQITENEQLVKDLVISSHHNSGIQDSNANTGSGEKIPHKVTTIENIFNFKCSSPVWCLHFIKTNLVSGHEDGKLRIWDMNTLDCTHTLDFHSKIAVESVQCNENIIVSTNYDQILVWDFSTHKMLYKFEEKGALFIKLKLIKNSLVALGFDGKLYSFNIQPWGEIRVEANTQAHYELSRALDADDEFVITGSEDKTLKVWRFGTLAFVKKLNGHSSEVWCISYWSRFVVSGDLSYNIRLWNVDTGECLRVLKVESYVWCLAFDNIRLVSGHHNGTITMWETADVLNVDSDACTFKTVSIDNKRITNVCIDDKIMVVSSNDTIKCFKLA